MSQLHFPAIDWERPWLLPLRVTASEVIAAHDWQSAANAMAARRQLVNHRGLPIVFAAQAELPARTAYETFISCTGRVPTRDNLHDFFNALVWLTYPLAKARLNDAQATEIARRSAPLASTPASSETDPVALHDLSAPVTSNVRGVLRDRATVFDENAALLVTSETSVEAALRQHDWNEALVAQRAAFGASCEVRLFGHALMEKLVTPYKAITGHVWVLRVERGYFLRDEAERQSRVDRELSQALGQGLLNLPAMSLPVLGVPKWWPGQDAGFYNDRGVFRPQRSARSDRQA